MKQFRSLVLYGFDCKEKLNYLKITYAVPPPTLSEKFSIVILILFKHKFVILVRKIHRLTE